MSSIKENNLSKSAKLSQTLKKNSLSQPVDLPKNSSSHISKINTEIESVQLAETTLGSHLKDCKILLDQIKERSDNSSDELNKNLMDSFKKVSEVFSSQVKNQTAENEKIQLKVDKLKQEKNDLQKMVVECSKRCTQLEEELGKY